MEAEKPRTGRLSLSGLLAAAGVLACGATLCGFLGQWFWFFDLMAHFRVQYVFGLALLAGLMFMWRDRRMGWVFAVCAVVNLAIVLPLFWGRNEPPPNSEPRLRAMLINVHTDGGDPGRVFEAIRREDPHFVMLQEISSRWTPMMDRLGAHYPYTLNQTMEDNFGIGLWSKYPLEGKVMDLGESMLPVVVATANAPSGPLRIVGVHPLPPGGGEQSRLRDDLLARVPSLVRRGGPTLVLGDLNTTHWGASFQRLLAQSSLRDSAKGFGVQPTWPAFAPLLGIPLDHCLHTPDIVIMGRRTGPNVSSDHLPLTIDFVMIQPNPRK